MIHILKTHTFSRLCICLIAFLFSVQSLSAQGAFIKRDTLTYMNVRFLKSTDKNYSKYIRQQNPNDSISIFTPQEVHSYGLKDGRVFYSFRLDSLGEDAWYFFERLYSGKYQIYYLNITGDQKGYYFKAGENAPLLAIPKKKKAYKEFLESYVQDCEKSKRNVRFLDLSEARLIRFMRDYENCEQSHLPRTRLGLKGGVLLNQYAASSGDLLFSEVDFPLNPNYFLGAYVEYPIGTTDFSLIGGINITRERNSVFFEKNLAYDLIVDAWRVDAPLLFRYSFFSRKHFPFIELGPVYSQQFNANNVLITYNGLLENADNIFLGFREPNISTAQLGANLGAGMVLNYDAPYSFLAQVGINKMFPLANDEPSLGNQSITLGFGILF